MAGIGEILEFSVASMIEDILLEYGQELCEVNVSSKKDAKAAKKRYDATLWLRKSVGVVAAKDLPAEPSEEDFRMGLRSGIILCTVLNKIEPGAVSKVEGAPFDSVIVPDGAPLSECPYFDNITNFLAAVEERGLPTFDVEDLEQGGKLSRVVNCVLALKSYGEWKKAGGNGSFKYEGNPKPCPKRKQIVRKSFDMDKCGDLWKDVEDKPLHMRVRDLLSDQKPEDIPVIIEIVLTKLTEEFEKRWASQKEKIVVNIVPKEKNGSQANASLPRARNEDIKPSPRDIISKERKNSKKEPLNNGKEENASSETKNNGEFKSFKDIINEMRKKAAGDTMNNGMEKKAPTFTKKFTGDTNNETEKKAPTFTNKFTGDTNNEMEKKAPTFTKKFTGDTNNEMEKKAPTFTKNFTGDISKEMEKKATTDTTKATSDINNKMEKKATTHSTKSTSDINNEMEKKATTDAKKSISDVNNQVEKKAVTTDAKKSIGDVNNEVEKKATIDAKKSIGDVNNEVEKKATIDAKKSTGDVNNEMEKKATTNAKKSASDVNNEMEKKATTDAKKSASDVNNEMEQKATTDAKKSASDVNNEMEQKATTDAKKSASDVNNEMEEKVITYAEKAASDINNEMEENSTTDALESDSDINDEMEEDVDTDDEEFATDLSIEMEENAEDDASDINEMEEDATIDDEMDDSDDIQNHMEMRKELEQKEMELKKEMEQKKMEMNKEMEQRAAEDAKEDEYYGWVNVECERLKVSTTKQQKLVEHQQKKLQALKNTFSTAKADIQLLRTNYQEEVDKLGKRLRSLAQAAAGYRKVVEENRKLYNQVQDLKGNIRVYCRSRPFFGGGKRPSAVDCIDEGTMAVITPGKGGKETRKNFTFNRVFGPNATQESVYKDTQPLIRSVLDGYNVCIFAYGQTGSGKTFTMSGPDDLTPETMGVNYRALNDLFEIQQQRKDMVTYTVSVQMLEIYNETVKDLLNADGASQKLEIRLGTANGINVPDANLVPVSTTDDVIRLMNLGHKNRAVGSTAMNQRSSRSHSCLTVHVNGKDLTSGSTVRGCMHLVDLAGSERADKTEAVGDRLKEATFINKSLSALGDVIASLAQKNAHVPYRNSKLTLLLQDALGGQAKTLMFIHVSPDPDTVGETISTLKFAERVSTVELGAAKSNKDDTDLKALKEQIAHLKAILGSMGGDPQEACGGDGVDDECDDQDPDSSQVDNNGVASKAKKPGPAQAKSANSNKGSPATKKPAAGGSSPATKKPAPDKKRGK